MSKASELLEEMDSIEEKSNFKQMNSYLNKMAFAKDQNRDVDPKMMKDAEALLKKMQDDEELSPNDLKKLEDRLSKVKGK